MIYAQYIERLRWTLPFFFFFKCLCAIHVNEWRSLKFSQHIDVHQQERKITSFQPWTIDYEENALDKEDEEGEKKLDRSIDFLTCLNILLIIIVEFKRERKECKIVSSMKSTRLISNEYEWNFNDEIFLHISRRLSFTTRFVFLLSLSSISVI